MFSHMDWRPTIAAIAGLSVPTHEWTNNDGKPIIFDGLDLSDSLLSKGPGKRDNFIYFTSQSFARRPRQELQGAGHSQRYLARTIAKHEGFRDLRSAVGPPVSSTTWRSTEPRRQTVMQHHPV
jgi:arylsulfatase A-like enzyme